MADYKTIRGTATFEYEEKRSRFIATASFADTEEKALAVLNAVRAANRTARHNVYAYVLQNGRTRYSDDGEPAKTAGTPVLETIGHAGERALNRLCPGGFSHYRQSLRVVDYLERDGQGLDLTWEVRNGIVTHTSGAWARTPEGCVVRRADHIAFLNHDIEDAITAGVLDARQLPPEAVAVLGHTKSERITTMITDLVAHSGNGKINFSPEVEAAYAVLKDFMYATVYVDKEAKREEKKVDKLISELYARLCDEPALMPNFYMQIAYNEGVDRAVTDYISGMSDEFATHLFEELFVPQKWKVL